MVRRYSWSVHGGFMLTSQRGWGEVLLDADKTRIGEVKALGLSEMSGVEVGAVQNQSLGDQDSRHSRWWTVGCG